MRYPVCLCLLAVLTVAMLPPCASAQIGLGSRQNSDQPIEIDSDTLEVQQDKQLALFRGKVDVVQGDTRLRSHGLNVYYSDRQTDQTASCAAPSPAPAPAAC